MCLVSELSILMNGGGLDGVYVRESMYLKVSGGAAYAGCGWAQRLGGPVEEIHPGDIVSFSPNEKHWHGAAPTTSVTHIAIQEKKDGKYVEWMEHVTDEQYRR